MTAEKATRVAESRNYRSITRDEFNAEVEQERSIAAEQVKGYDTRKIPSIETGEDFNSALGVALLRQIDPENKYPSLQLPGNKIGIFKTEDKEAEKRMGSFFERVLRSSIKITLDIHDDLYHNYAYVKKILDARGDNLTRDEIIALKYTLEQSDNKNRPAPTQEEESKLLALSSLVVELCGILSVTDEDNQRLQNTPFKNRSLRRNDYNFTQPATVTHKIENTRTNSLIDITIIGLPISKFEGKGNSRYNGAFPQEAKIWMHEDARDGRRSEEIDEIIRRAEEIAIYPHIEISLYKLFSDDKSLRARISSELAYNSRETAITLSAEGFDSHRYGAMFFLDKKSERPFLHQVAQDFSKLTA